MFNESTPLQSFSMTETSKQSWWVFFGLAALAIVMGIIGDTLKFSAAGFDTYELLCVVLAAILAFIGFSLRNTYQKSLQIPLLPEKIFRRVVLVIALAGMSWAVIAGMTFAGQTNTNNLYGNYSNRLPRVESMRFGNMVLSFIVGLVIIFLSARFLDHGHKFLSALLTSLINQWNTIPKRFKMLFFVGVALLIGLFNYAMVMRQPFAYTGGWDAWTGVYRDPKEMIIINSNEGLKKGCSVCSSDLQPLENITAGDDIGLSFAFGVVVRLNLFRPELDSYQQFIALLIAGAMLFGTVIVAVGYRSVLVGITFGLFMSLFSPLPLYQSLLITMYWVPGGAAVVTSALVLAFIARSERTQRRDKRETLLYVVGCIIWGFIGGLSYLGRSNSGVSMLIPAVIVLLYLVIRYRCYVRTAILFAVLLISFAIPLLSFRSTLSWRFGKYEPPNPTDTGHGFSHALYVGLGYVTNSENILWLDLDGLKHAQEECSPDIVFMSSNYFSCMRNLYIKTILKDPGLLIRNLLAKSESILQTSMTHLSFFWLLPLLVFLLRARFIYLLLAFTLLMFLLPGLLVFPYFSYMMGYGEILIAALIVGFVDFAQSVFASFKPLLSETTSPS